MSVRLSSKDLANLEIVQRLLLSPLEFQTPGAWLDRISEAIQQATGADISVFLIPEPDGLRFFSNQLAEEDIRQYPERVSRYHGWNALRRQLELGVWRRDALHQPYLDEYYRSEYYNEYIVPLRALDAIGLSIQAGRPSHRAEMLLHHDSTRARPFGEKELMLLKLIASAFKAGVLTHLQLACQERNLAQLLDALDHGIVRYDVDGRERCRNAAITRMLETDPDRAQIQYAMWRLVRSLSSRARRSALHQQLHPAGPFLEYLHTGAAVYRLHGFIDSGSTLDMDRGVTIILQYARDERPSETLLRERFGLTAREARVACLLAERRSNQEIADALLISVHTARHHTERVLEKLGVHSRAAVAPRIAR